MGRGGKRKGAGRKPLPEEMKKQAFSTKLPGWLKEWMSFQPESNGAMITAAMKEKYNLKEPKQ